MNNTKYKLSVVIPVRDRMILTSKCIESIWRNTTKFDKINIYIFDNKSDLTEDRVSYFYKLLQNSLICHYSYDTDVSVYRSFGKGIIFQRWIGMMNAEEELYKTVKDPDHQYVHYYALIDNDMIMGPKWDELFISAIENVRYKEKDLRYLIKSPGGVEPHHRKHVYNVVNKFDDVTKFDIVMGNYGGGSGFWFMDYGMLNKVKWSNKELQYIYQKNKRHDSTTWKLITHKYGDIIFNAGVISPYPQEENPLIIHAGGYIGSICNKLNKDEYTKEEKLKIAKAEEEFLDMSIDEILKKCSKFSSW